ncbi:MAG: protocatechuate dioxygenase [Balneolaceae bacterium]
MKELSRRQILLGFGAAGTSALLAPFFSSKINALTIIPSKIPNCIVTPESTEGPFYFATNLIRKDITEGLPGTLLDLKLKIVDAESCSPIQDAIVDVWSCDSNGEYSGYETVYSPSGDMLEQRGLPKNEEMHSNDARPKNHEEPNNEKKFMRGAQVTNDMGEVEFLTIYPGWYPDRAPHIHIKVYVNDKEVFTSQMYFPEEITDKIYAQEVYAQKKGMRLLNTDDNLFLRTDGKPIIQITEVEEGVIGTLTFGVNQS